MSLKLQIDHVGLLGPGIAELVDEFSRLGFSVIGPTELTSIDEEGNRVGLGQYSAHVMFESDYIELTAVERPTPNHHLAHFLHPPWGLRLLLPACDDITAAHDACTKNELCPSPIQEAARTLDYRPGEEARFRWFGLPGDAWPDVLLAYVSHLTPELVFDADVAAHENGARGLCCLFYIADALPGQYALLAAEGKQEIVVVPPNDAERVLGFDVSRTTPFAGIGINVDDLAVTVALLKRAGIETRATDRSCTVQLQSGVCVVFTQAAL